MAKYQYHIISWIGRLEEPIDFGLLPSDNIAMVLVPLLEKASNDLNNAIAQLPEKDWEVTDHYVSFQDPVVIITFLIRRYGGGARKR